MTKGLSDYTMLLAMALFFAIFNGWIAYKKGFFSYPLNETKRKSTVSGIILLGGFFVFIGVQVLVVPLLLSIYYYFKLGGWGDFSEIRADPQTMGWTNVSSMGATFLGVLLYSFFLTPQLRKAIWDRGEAPRLKNLFFGALTWILAYPVVMVLVQVFSLLLNWIFQIQAVDQVPVKALKLTLAFPVLFSATLVCMVALVPIVEEFLFRGCLQTWLRDYFGRKISILLSSLVFALFHVASIQGISNLIFVLGLFILSCFLGFLYERQQSLWAPIGLHVIFNTISVVAVVLS